VSDYGIRQARTSETERILALHDEAVRWLAAIGLDQWQTNHDRRRAHVETDLGEGTVFVVEHLDRVVATITVDKFADTDFWRKEDGIDEALYAHRMVVTRDKAGNGLGSAMLDWAAKQAEHCNRSWLRLDAWSTNDKLHAYYRRLGFEEVRNIEVAGRGSGALFQRDAGSRCGDGPKLLDLVDSPLDCDGDLHRYRGPRGGDPVAARYDVVQARAVSHSRRSASGASRSGSW
jgi:GNAT superfamily N-acetyltransferase